MSLAPAQQLTSRIPIHCKSSLSRERHPLVASNGSEAEYRTAQLGNYQHSSSRTNTTIAYFVDRFRNGVPTPRQDRNDEREQRHVGRPFWWITQKDSATLLENKLLNRPDPVAERIGFSLSLSQYKEGCTFDKSTTEIVLEPISGARVDACNRGIRQCADSEGLTTEELTSSFTEMGDSFTKKSRTEEVAESVAHQSFDDSNIRTSLTCDSTEEYAFHSPSALNTDPDLPNKGSVIVEQSPPDTSYLMRELEETLHRLESDNGAGSKVERGRKLQNLSAMTWGNGSTGYEDSKCLEEACVSKWIGLLPESPLESCETASPVEDLNEFSDHSLQECRFAESHCVGRPALYISPELITLEDPEETIQRLRSRLHNLDVELEERRGTLRAKDRGADENAHHHDSKYSSSDGLTYLADAARAGAHLPTMIGLGNTAQLTHMIRPNSVSQACSDLQATDLQTLISSRHLMCDEAIVQDQCANDIPFLSNASAQAATKTEADLSTVYTYSDSEPEIDHCTDKWSLDNACYLYRSEENFDSSSHNRSRAFVDYSSSWMDLLEPTGDNCWKDLIVQSCMHHMKKCQNALFLQARPP